MSLMECFLCQSIRGGESAVQEDALFDREGALRLMRTGVISGFVLGRTVGRMPMSDQDAVDEALCAGHKAQIRSVVASAIEVNAGTPGFDKVRPYVQGLVPPILKLVK